MANVIVLLDSVEMDDWAGPESSEGQDDNILVILTVIKCAGCSEIQL